MSTNGEVGAMAISKGEAWIREQFIKIFKKYIGKGPRVTEVKIFKKMLLVIFQDILTPLEKNILSIGHNLEEVSKLRDKISEPALEEYKQVLADLTGDKVVDVLKKNNFASNERYYLFIFENNIETLLRDKANLDELGKNEDQN